MNDNLNTKVITGKVRMSYVRMGACCHFRGRERKILQFLLLYLR